MEEKRFTPGPWFVQDDEWTDGETANITSDFRSDNSIIPVAQISGGGSESGFDGDFSLEQKANARLIAAAPELLEALQDMVSRIEYYANLDGSNKPSIEDWAYTYNSSDMDAARNAIAKALGKE